MSWQGKVTQICNKWQLKVLSLLVYESWLLYMPCLQIGGLIAYKTHSHNHFVLTEEDCKLSFQFADVDACLYIAETGTLPSYSS